MNEEISLCMIVKNEEKDLEKCLNSIRDLVREMIIVDTGSTDKTKEIAKKFTDKVYDFSWKDDFSQARNFSIKKATQPWILVLDADETLSKIDKDKVKKAIKTDSDAFLLDWRTYTNNTGISGWMSSKDDFYEESKSASGYYISKVLRLFKNNKGYEFQGRIHETPHKSIQDSGGKIQDSKIIIHHFGELNEEKKPEKKQQYVDLLKTRLKEKDFGEKTEDYICFELSRELINLKNYEEALEYAKRASEIKENPKYLLASGSLQILLNQLDKAEIALKRAVILEPKNSSIHDNLGVIYAKRGEFNKAIKKFSKSIELNPKSADAHYNLGIAYKEIGKREKAEKEFQKAQELNPKYKNQQKT